MAHSLTVMLIAALSALGMSCSDAFATNYKYQIIHAFCSKKTCRDGLEPLSRLLLDQSGNLYGTTISGGKADAGNVFELSPRGKDKWTEKTLFEFCPVGKCREDARPTGNLIIDSAGNLYGLTDPGGSAKGGVIYELSALPDSGKRKATALYVFCRDEPACKHGSTPVGGLTYLGAAGGAPYDGTSPLYGIAAQGGAHGRGFVFELTRGSKTQLKDIFDFETSCRLCEGAISGSLIMDDSGNLYEAYNGGLSSSGAVIELSPAGHKWSETILYSFCALGGCADGEHPGSILMNAAGEIFGTTSGGGTTNATCPNGSSGCGVVYKLAFDGNAWNETVLHSFCAQPDCADGDSLWGGLGLAIDQSGALFGATGFGGGNDIDPNGIGGGVVFGVNGSESVLHAFCAEDNCTDGEYPGAGLTIDAMGDVFGTASLGGPNKYGVVFELSPEN